MRIAAAIACTVAGAAVAPMLFGRMLAVSACFALGGLWGLYALGATLVGALT